MATSSKSGDKPVKPAAKASKPKPAAKPAASAKAVKPVAGASKPKAAVPKVAAPKAASPRKSAAKSAATPSLSAEQRRYYVEVAAYYIAERRGFDGGSEFDDWVQAEAEIDRLLREGVLKP